MKGYALMAGFWSTFKTNYIQGSFFKNPLACAQSMLTTLILLPFNIIHGYWIERPALAVLQTDGDLEYELNLAKYGAYNYSPRTEEDLRDKFRQQAFMKKPLLTKKPLLHKIRMILAAPAFFVFSYGIKMPLYFFVLGLMIIPGEIINAAISLISTLFKKKLPKDFYKSYFHLENSVFDFDVHNWNNTWNIKNNFLKFIKNWVTPVIATLGLITIKWALDRKKITAIKNEIQKKWDQYLKSIPTTDNDRILEEQNKPRYDFLCTLLETATQDPLKQDIMLMTIGKANKEKIKKYTKSLPPNHRQSLDHIFATISQACLSSFKRQLQDAPNSSMREIFNKAIEELPDMTILYNIKSPNSYYTRDLKEELTSRTSFLNYDSFYKNLMWHGINDQEDVLLSSCLNNYFEFIFHNFDTDPSRYKLLNALSTKMPTILLTKFQHNLKNANLFLKNLPQWFKYNKENNIMILCIPSNAIRQPHQTPISQLFQNLCGYMYLNFLETLPISLFNQQPFVINNESIEYLNTQSETTIQLIALDFFTKEQELKFFSAYHQVYQEAVSEGLLPHPALTNIYNALLKHLNTSSGFELLRAITNPIQKNPLGQLPIEILELIIKIHIAQEDFIKINIASSEDTPVCHLFKIPNIEETPDIMEQLDQKSRSFVKKINNTLLGYRLPVLILEENTQKLFLYGKPENTWRLTDLYINIRGQQEYVSLFDFIFYRDTLRGDNPMFPVLLQNIIDLDAHSFYEPKTGLKLIQDVTDMIFGRYHRLQQFRAEEAAKRAALAAEKRTSPILVFSDTTPDQAMQSNEQHPEEKATASSVEKMAL